MRLGGAAVKDLTGIQMVEGHFVNGQIFVDILRLIFVNTNETY